jgi:hypothetical protein
MSFSQEYFTLRGIVTDSETGTTLRGISVVVEENSTGTITNRYGEFLLHLSKGSYNITYTAIGYSDEKETIVLDKDIEKKITLHSKESAPKSKEKKVSILKFIPFIGDTQIE